nr:hypothetical protein [uncultured Campylobacter sp.]
MFPKPQKFKCPSCGKSKMSVIGCQMPAEFCPKCHVPMKPCDTNWFDRLLGRKNYRDLIEEKLEKEQKNG